MFGFQWHLTDRCNRKCLHCYQDTHETNSELTSELRLKAAELIMQSLTEEAVTINLTGGEPLLLPDLLDLIRYLDNYANLEEINIISNGTIENEQILHDLSLIRSFKHFKISLESGKPEINDAIRGKDSLKNLRRTIPLYKALTGRDVTLMMTLSRMNFRSIAETVEFAREVGAAGILFERFIPLGTGLGIADAVLGADDWFAAVKEILAVARIDAEPDSMAAYRAFGLELNEKLDPEDRLEVAFCNLGAESMALMPDGTVFPCRRLQIPVGNILQEPFSAIRSRLADWECSRIRPQLHGEICGICPFEDCPGCRALAMALSGDPLDDDPQCLLNRRED